MDYKEYPCLLFDLDGTLIDSRAGVLKCVRKALEHFNMPWESDEELMKFIGPPLADSFGTFYDFTPEQAAEANTVYRSYYSTVGLLDCTVYDGIPQVLRTLKAAGKRIFMATSKVDVYANRILEHFGLSEYFEFVGGASMDGKRGKKHEVLLHVLESCGITADRVLLIGDSKYDVAGAAKVGIECLGVLYGFGNEEEHRIAGTKKTVKTPLELLDVLL